MKHNIDIRLACLKAKGAADEVYSIMTENGHYAHPAADDAWMDRFLTKLADDGLVIEIYAFRTWREVTQSALIVALIVALIALLFTRNH